MTDFQPFPKVEDLPDVPEGVQENWEPGTRPFFEYHCYEGHDSADAQLWYRSHRQVTVLRRNWADEVANGVNGQPWAVRNYECGTPATYQVRFDDGFEGTATEDELLTVPEF